MTDFLRKFTLMLFALPLIMFFVGLGWLGVVDGIKTWTKQASRNEIIIIINMILLWISWSILMALLYGFLCD